jgi:arylamine N-acetyltransferase
VVATGTNITVGAITHNSNYVSVAAPSNMTADNAEIEFTVTITDKTGSGNIFTKTQSFSKSVKADTGEDGVNGNDGLPGSAGADAKVVSITAEQYQIKYNQNGTSPDVSTIEITADGQNTTNTPYYRFSVDGTEVQSKSTDNTYTYSSPTTNFNSVLIEVELYDGNVSTVSATDSLTITGLRDGADTLNVLLNNEAVSFAAALNGNVADYSGGAVDITAYEGTTKLTPDNSGSPANSTFKVTYVADTNITVGSVTYNTSGKKIEYGSPSAMNQNSAEIIFSVTVKDKTGTDFIFYKNQSFSKSVKGDTGEDGVTGATGATGAAGQDAKIVSLEATEYQIKYDQNGDILSAGNITFTASEQNITGVPYYTFYLNNVEDQARSTSSTYSYTKPSSIFSSDTVEVEVHDGNTSTVSARDSVSITGLQDGADTLNVLLDNEAVTLPADNGGTVSDYSPGIVNIFAYEGINKLAANSTLGANSTFKASASGSGITPGALTYHADYISVAAPTSMGSDSASISFTITVKDKTGNTHAFTKTQSFSKSRKGNIGATGPSGSNGSDAKVVNLTAANYLVAYDASGSNPDTSGNITITAASLNFTDAYFKFTCD